MNAEGHKKRAHEIEDSMLKLLPDPEGRHVAAIVELSYGLLQHLVAFGMENKHGRHLDTHVGLPAELRRSEESEIADIFETLDTLRMGRWYGSKSNGRVVKQCLEYIEKIKEWLEK